MQIEDFELSRCQVVLQVLKQAAVHYGGAARLKEEVEWL